MTSTPTPLSPENDSDFQQLTGAFNRPIAPNPAFAERLRQQAIAASNNERETVMQSTAPAAVNSAKQHRIIPMSKVRRSGGRILESIAAAALVIALLSSMLLMNRLENGPSTQAPDPSGQRLAAMTSPIASATPAQDAASESGWTDPGHTNAFPAGFDPETAQPAEPLGDLDFNSDNGIVVGDILILTGRPADAAPADVPLETNMVAVNLSTGEQLWSKYRSTLTPPVAGTDAFYTIEMSSGGNHDVNFMLVSVSPDNGLPNWGHTMLTKTEEEMEEGGNIHDLSEPIEIDGTVYVSNSLGDVSAFDADTGKLKWQSPESDSSEVSPFAMGSVVADEQFVYATGKDNTIMKRDRATGNVIETFEIDGQLTTDMQRSLRLQNNVLVVHSWMLRGPRTDVAVISTETGEVIWSSHIGPLVGSAAITDGIIGIPYIAGLDGTPTSEPIPGIIQISFYDLETGEPISDYTSPESGSASLSVSGSVTCIHEREPAISCVDFDDPNRTLRSIDVGVPYAAEGPPSHVLFWNGNAIVLGHEGGPRIIRSTDADARSSDA